MVLESLFFIYGVLTLLKVFLSILNCLLPFIRKNKFNYQKGTWAIVTACTDGLGLGFVEELAKRGLNIIQVGRNPSKLEKQEIFLKEVYKIEVRSITKDFEDCPKDPISFYSDIFSKVSDLNVTVLINNVGGSHVKQFIHSTKVLSILSLNIFPIVFMTKMFLQTCKDHENFGIINISSVASLFPGTRLAMYRACKSFDFVFTDVLSSENEIFKRFGNGGSVLCLTPALIDTPATKHLKDKTLAISKYECADRALSTLGTVRYSSGHWKHQIMYLLNLVMEIFEPVIGDMIIKKFEEDN